MTANMILGFIEQRLQADVADGATPAQLQSRLRSLDELRLKFIGNTDFLIEQKSAALAIKNP